MTGRQIFAPVDQGFVAHFFYSHVSHKLFDESYMLYLYRQGDEGEGSGHR